jgi:site-specific DNA recombinase
MRGEMPDGFRQPALVGPPEEVYTSTERVRPRLSVVQHRAGESEFDVLLVYTQDRLARKQRQLNRILDEFDEDDVTVWSVLEGEFQTDAMGVLQTSLRGFGSETENEQRTERTMRGQRARVEAGHMLGSAPKPTFGYRWPDDERDKDGRLLKHRYAVNPEEAAIVRQLYEWVLAGVSMRQIATRLNDLGIQSPYAGVGRYAVSGEWRHQTIKALVTNPQYRGEAVGLA